MGTDENKTSVVMRKLTKSVSPQHNVVSDYVTSINECNATCQTLQRSAMFDALYTEGDLGREQEIWQKMYKEILYIL